MVFFKLFYLFLFFICCFARDIEKEFEIDASGGKVQLNLENKTPYLIIKDFTYGYNMKDFEIPEEIRFNETGAIKFEIVNMRYPLYVITMFEIGTDYLYPKITFSNPRNEDTDKVTINIKLFSDLDYISFNEESNTLTFRTFHEDIEISQMTNEEKDSKCTICLEEFGENETVGRLKCGHIFHLKCIHRWLKKRNRNCPICRRTSIRDSTTSFYLD